jgi:hypothetical protein
MAFRRSAFASPMRSKGSVLGSEPSVTSGSLQAGQRLAKPGLSGFSSNSSEQITQILIGNGIPLKYDSSHHIAAMAQ